MADAPKAEAATKKVVKYVGTADIREITAAQWKGAGVENQKGSEWNVANGHELPASDFNSDAMRYFERDSGFKVQDVPA